MRISDWSSDVCSSDLRTKGPGAFAIGENDHRGSFDGSELLRSLDRPTIARAASQRPGWAISQSSRSSIASCKLSARALLIAISGLAPRATAASSRYCSAARSEEHTSELQSLMRIQYAVF